MAWGDTHDTFEALVGKNITGLFLSEDYLIFSEGTDKPQYEYQVAGDCCSSSYFQEVVGVEKLLANGPVISWKEIDLEPDEISPFDYDEYDDTALYGFELVTEHPIWGEQTTVVAFRNESNGYYGGWMEFCGMRSPSRPLPRDGEYFCMDQGSCWGVKT